MRLHNGTMQRCGSGVYSTLVLLSPGLGRPESDSRRNTTMRHAASCVNSTLVLLSLGRGTRSQITLHPSGGMGLSMSSKDSRQRGNITRRCAPEPYQFERAYPGVLPGCG